MQQKKIFTGGIDTDTTDEFLPEGRDRYRLNVRVLSSDTSNIGAIETVKGNTLTTFTLPAGTSTVIGAKEDQLRKKLYYFLHNTANNHSILEYDEETNTVAKVFESSILDFSLTHLITGINIVTLNVNNHLLYWTDDFNEPRKINIEKGKFFMVGNFVDGYKSPFDPSILYRIKEPPQCAPTSAWSNTIVNEQVFNAIQSAVTPQSVAALGTAIVAFDTELYDPNAEYDPVTYTWTVGTTGYDNVAATLYMITAGTASVLVEILVNAVAVESETFSLIAIEQGFTISAPNIMLTATDTVQIQVTSLDNAFDISTTGKSTFGALFYGTTSGVGQINYLFKKLFTFKVQYVFDDSEVSSWSPISAYEFPETQLPIYSNTGEDYETQDNLLTVTVPTGSSIVTKIRIAAKPISFTDFSLIAELNKSELEIADDTTYDFLFFNDGNYVQIDTRESNKLFDNVPIKSKSQEIAENRIDDGLITEGYDGVSVDMRLPISYVPVTTNSNTFFPAQSYLKSGGVYKFGIVYYDHANRSGTSNIQKGKSTELVRPDINTYGTTLYIPFLTDPAYDAPHGMPNLDMSYVPQINPEIYNAPPSWATHYQIVRSRNESIDRFIQFTSEDNRYLDENLMPVASTDPTVRYAQISISNIVGRYKEENPNSRLVYEPVPGDRLRLIANVSSGSPAFNTISPFFQFNDSDIIDYLSGTGVVTIKMSSTTPLNLFPFGGALFEIYSPAENVINDNELMFEVDECYEIGTDINGNRVHLGGSVDQLFESFAAVSYAADTFVANVSFGHGLSVNDLVKITSANYSIFGIISATTATTVTVDTTGYDMIGVFAALTSGIISRAAVVTLNSGDVFRRFCDMPWLAGATVLRLYMYIETSEASNMWASNATDYGRPNRIDADYRQITRPSTIYYSEALIPETFINGLSTVYDDSFETYDERYGGIYKLYYEDQRLIMFQELKCGMIPVQQIIYNDLSLNNTVGASTVVLSPQAIYYAGEYGIGKQPESFAVYGTAKYFVDIRRGVVCRLSVDGITPISDTGFNHQGFTTIFKALLASSKIGKIYGVYDTRFNEYILAVEGPTRGTGGITVAWNEKANAWSTAYSFQPEYMCQNGVDFVSFVNGGLWRHNQNAVQNNFYGVQYTSDIIMIMNDNPSDVKLLEAMGLESADIWTVPSITTPEGQATNLIAADFTTLEGQQYAPIWRDTNTPNVVLPELPLFAGDPMRSRIFTVTLRYTGTTYSKLFAVNLNYIVSNLHNR